VPGEPTPLSANNPRIADLRRLSGRRRSRVEAGRFVIEGPVPVLELLDAGVPLLEVLVDLDLWRESAPDAPIRRIAALAADRSIPVWGLAPSVLSSVADTAAPQGVLATATREVATVADLAAGDGPVVVLVDLADPGNAGTIVRAAEAAGAAGVVFAGSSTDPFGPKAVRSAAGSIARLPIAECADLDEVLDVLAAAGRILVATMVRGGGAPESIDLTEPVVLVIGSEAHGLPVDVAERCHHVVTIPMAPAVESINVAMAGAALLFEAARQRRVAG